MDTQEAYMLELFIIRHGLADNSLEDQTKDDKRPLKKKRKDCRDCGTRAIP